MLSSGLIEAVRNEPGNMKYEYFYPENDPETVLLIDRWENRHALDLHHKSEMMPKIAALREKYNLRMLVGSNPKGSAISFNLCVKYH